MTIAEKWQQEGWLKGRQEGRQEGLLETIELGISLRFGDDQAAQIMPFIRPLCDLNDLQSIKEGLKQAHDMPEFMAILKPYIKI